MSAPPNESDSSESGDGRRATSMELPRTDELLPATVFASQRHSTDGTDQVVKEEGISERIRGIFAGTSAGRQSGLPPKSKKEEKRHVKEMQRISDDMKRQQVRDERETKRSVKMAEKKETKIREALQTWQEDILPHWEKKKQSKQVHSLVKLGVPSPIRGKVWSLFIENNLGISHELFGILGQRAARAKEDLAHRLGKEETVELVSIDLDRTFPALSIFQQGGPLHEPLRTVLEAYVTYRPDVGYVQGMSFIAAMLLLYLEEFEAFCGLANIMSRPFFLSFFRMDMMSIGQHINCFKELLDLNLPALSRHLTQIGVSPEMYVMDWFLTLFSKSLDVETATRLWDCFFAESLHQYFIIKCALGILKCLTPDLIVNDFDYCCHKLTHLRDHHFNVDELLSCIGSVNVSAGKYDNLMRKYAGSSRGSM